MTDAIKSLVFQHLSQKNLDAILKIENNVQLSPWSTQKFQHCFIDSHYLLTGMFNHRQLIGYCIMQVNPPEAEIHNFAIDKAFQNQGFGHFFMAHVKGICSDLNLEQLFLEVRLSNQVAINVYKKAGFTQVGCRTDYYRSDSITESALIFKLELK